MDSSRSCRTCVHFHDDGKCYRYPPSAPVFAVSFNGVTHYPKALKNGSAMLDFPTVAETDVCGEYVSRAADHSCDGGYEEES